MTNRAGDEPHGGIGDEQRTRYFSPLLSFFFSLFFSFFLFLSQSIADGRNQPSTSDLGGTVLIAGGLHTGQLADWYIPSGTGPYRSIRQTLLRTLADTLKNSKGPVKILLYTTIKEARSKMNGKEVFRFAVRCVPHSIEAALEEAGLTSSNIDWLLLHQVISNLANYGNTSAASIPLALDEAVRTGKVQAGNTIATAGFGAGLTWGSVIMRWK
ncbi:hypothetical protein B296_00044086 [Ensete ventricosum]|uniref:Beta-ketoacyl-[acyl-carrier-protein] synthase III C-terminal domain-containing protein n=1 Tax=Ensete ventricosum TaxID=4639 RepID=A0A426XL75_ENSVE|nr:hypothetical protein B296_00044086 [Ensete ventricosum]